MSNIPLSSLTTSERKRSFLNSNGNDVVSESYRDTEVEIVHEREETMDDGLMPTPRVDKGDALPDVNVYQQKKTLAQGMMDLALLSANANQLRYVIETGNKHSYYIPGITLISLSLFLQIAVGIGLIWNSRYNVNNDNQIHKANKINNFTVIGIFIITVLNVFISAFGVPGIQEYAPLKDASTDTEVLN